MKLYNSLTRTKIPFKTLKNKKVSMYVCGITPYDTTHLGHASVYVFFDTLSRVFTHKGYEIEYTQNVTDIDDDILKRAKKVGQDWKELGKFWTDKFLSDTKHIHIIPPTHYVKATDSIDEIIRIVKKLEEKGIAYEKNGNVYFSVHEYKKYGQLSGFSREQMIELSRERGANPDDPNKKNPLDFVLWQKSLQDEPYWKSPWGNGRPGWHIECSAMVREYLGDQIDIHGGGFDLIYPHHESEIAQSESATGKKPFATYWMHVAMLSYQGEKMSKSLGNLVLVSDLLKTFTANQIRFLLLSHQYRTPWEYTLKDFEEKNKELELLENALAVPVKASSSEGNAKAKQYEKEFMASLDDDMDTVNAIQVLIRLSKEIIEKENTQLQDVLRTCFNLFGLK